MRNLLALFGAALLTVVGAGWYLGWYKVRSQPASVPGQTSVIIDMHTDKISADLQKGEAKLQQWLDKKEGEKSGAEVKKAGGDLMLPSPSSKKTTDEATPLFQFHRGKGPALEIGGDAQHPLIQIGGSDKK